MRGTVFAPFPGVTTDPRRGLLVTIVTALLFALALAPAATAAPKRVASFFGTAGTGDGQFASGAGNGPVGIAINQGGTGGIQAGSVYVVDRASHRIERFDASGIFKSAFGRNVGGAGVNICASGCVAGATGGNGGALNTPQSIAVDQFDGALYVLDGANLRLQKFKANGEFLRAWGAGVVDGGAAGTGNLTSGSTSVTSLVTTSKVFLVGQTITGAGIPAGTTITAATATSLTLSQAATATASGVSLTVAAGAGNNPVNEQQTVTLPAAVTGGTFTLTFSGSTTAAIAWDASPGAVQAALESLTSIGAGNVAVTSANPGGGVLGGPYTVEFKGKFVDTDVAQMTASGTNLVSSGSKTVSLATLVNGASGFEICTAAAECRAGVSGFLGGAFGSTFTGQVAVDAATGAVYVTDPANRRVQQFTPAGAFVRAFGFDVDSSNPSTGFEICTRAENCKTAAAQGTDPGRFATNQPTRVAVDSTGALYTVESNTSNFRVQKFTPTSSGLTPSVFANATVTGTSTGNTPTDVAIDPATDRVYVAKAFLAGSFSPCPNGDSSTAERRILEFDSSGETLLQADMQCSGINSVNGMAVRSSSAPDHADNVYLTSTTDGQRVYVLDETGATSPSVTAEPATAIGGHTATLNGTLSRNEPSNALSVLWHFEYSGDDGKNWVSAPAANASVSGATVDPVTLTPQVVNGLEANTAYRVRLVATKQYNSTPRVVSAETTFQTPQLPLEGVVTLAADAVTTNTARLKGSLNANNEPTTWRFEYVDDATYQQDVADSGPEHGFDHAAVTADENSDGGVATPVASVVTGLAPTTTYHFRIVAENPLGPAVAGAEKTFLTRSDAQVPPDGRAYELVSPADKPGGVGIGGYLSGTKADGEAAVIPGVASLDGNRYISMSQAGHLALGGFIYVNDYAFSERTDLGWVSHSPFVHRDFSLSGGSAVFLDAGDATDDLSTVKFQSNGALLFPELAGFPAGSPSYVASWDSRWETLSPLAAEQGEVEKTALSDGSERLLLSGSTLRGLLGSTDPTLDQLASSSALYARTLPAGGPEDTFPGGGANEVVGTCTGTGGDRTLIPSREASGKLGAQECPAPAPGRDQALISSRGASIGRGLNLNTAVPTDPAISDDGRRVFFNAPDPAATGSPTACAAGTGTETSCPSQLYIRQLDGSGQPTVRWISRSAVPNQDATLTAKVVFEGASKTGDKIFFRTNAPLTADDPNGQAITPTDPRPILTGTPSATSWDLYQYDIPSGPDGRPDGTDPGTGTLTRVSAGPTGNGDGNVNVGGTGASLRFVSDDGNRLYFTSNLPIPGVATNGAPTDGTSTVAAGTATDATATNLYYYDATKPLVDRWEFVARLPKSGMGSCATTGGNPAEPRGTISNGATYNSSTSANCLRGTDDGSFVTFWTQGKLVAGDPEASSGDVYAFDATNDRLTRVSTPQGVAATPYGCEGSVSSPSAFCYGDGGWNGVVKAMPGVVTAPSNPSDRIAFFQSKSQLLPADRDAKFDVYEWKGEGTDGCSEVGGCLFLISPGESETGVYYAGNSADGRDVFLETREKLNWEDIDGVMDIYDARVGGGFPQPQPPVPCDPLAEQCQGGAVAPPAANSAGSTNAPSGGNAAVEPPKLRKCPKGKVRKGNRCVKKRHRKHAHRRHQAGRNG